MAILRELQRNDEALSVYDQLIRIAGLNEDTYVGKGDLLQELGRYKEALYTYKEGISVLRYDDKRSNLAQEKKTLLLHSLFHEILIVYRIAIILIWISSLCLIPSFILTIITNVWPKVNFFSSFWFISLLIFLTILIITSTIAIVLNQFYACDWLSSSREFPG